jgi:superfamily II DNA or RNA helicase
LKRDVPGYKRLEMGFAMKFRMVLWEDLPPDTLFQYDLPSRDLGVDIVRLNVEKCPVATGQMKHYGPNSKVKYDHLTNFAWFSHFIVGVDELILGLLPVSSLTSHAQMVVNRHPGFRISRGTLEEFEDLAANFLGQSPPPAPECTPSLMLTEPCATESLGQAPPAGAAPVSTPFSLRRGQREALEAFRDSPKQVFRVQLPCGYGKSQLAVELLKDYHRVLILVNSKDLLHQFCERLRTTTSHVLVQLGGKQTAWPSRDYSKKQALVVVSTYQSASKVSKKHPWKLIVCDEAHHVQGKDDEEKVEEVEEDDEDDEEDDSVSSPTSNKDGARGWRRDVNNLTDKETRTLELSATHRVSAKDVDYSVSLREAINEEAISDYQIRLHVLSHYGDTTKALLRLVASECRLWGPTLLYFNTTSSASNFCTALCNKNVRAVILTANTSVDERRKIASQLEPGDIEVVCLCGCWNESFDHPCISAVVFAEPRGSPINKVQVAQRGSRLHHAKAFYRIILWTTAGDDDKVPFGVGNELLRCFFDHDEELRECVRHRGGGKNPLRFRVVLDPKLEVNEEEAELLYIRVWDRCGRLCRLTQREKAHAFVVLEAKGEKVFDFGGELTFSDGFSVGNWWNTATKPGGIIERDEDVKAILMANNNAKSNYEALVAKRREKLSHKDKALEFVTLAENGEKNVFKKGCKLTFSDDSLVGGWWEKAARAGGHIEKDKEVRRILMANNNVESNYKARLAKRS